MPAEPRSLGSFTSERDAEEENPLEGLYFDLDEERFDFDGGHANLLKISELADIAVTGKDGMDQAAMMANLALSLKAALGEECVNGAHPKNCPGEYGRFAEHVEKHHTPPERVAELAQLVNEAAQEAVEEATSRPTRRPSGSHAGRSDRAAQLSQLISAAEQDDEGEFYTPDDPQPQPQPGPDMPTIGIVTERDDGGQTEREMQLTARREARNALLAVKTRPPARDRQPKSASKARRTG